MRVIWASKSQRSQCSISALQTHSYAQNMHTPIRRQQQEGQQSLGGMLKVY